MKIFLGSVFLNCIVEKLVTVCGSKEQAEQECWWILQHVTGKSKAELLIHENVELPFESIKKLNLLLKQRIEYKKPLAYVLGFVPFCGLDILVEPPILIPRPETEEWTCWFISVLQKAGINRFCLLDLCCGSGCIGLAIAKAFPEANILGVDIFVDAIKLSNLNKNKLQLNNIEFLQSNMFENLQQNSKFDFIVSNPPYLSEKEYGRLDPEVGLWEDKIALVADQGGMKFYDNILSNIHHYLSEYSSDIPRIVFEIGPAQTSIECLLRDMSYKKFEVHKDMQGKRRWVEIFIKK